MDDRKLHFHSTYLMAVRSRQASLPLLLNLRGDIKNESLEYYV